jgi:preprotein translocase subunit SecA
VALTPAGVAEVERLLSCANLYDAEHFTLLTAVQDSLHAHTLLHRDVRNRARDARSGADASGARSIR